jgi:uncharacterized protein GlcG (DUF336 family)
LRWRAAGLSPSPSGTLRADSSFSTGSTNTQPASQEIAVEKARSAARLRRPTKALEDAIAGGRTAFLSFGAVVLEGGPRSG